MHLFPLLSVAVVPDRTRESAAGGLVVVPAAAPMMATVAATVTTIEAYARIRFKVYLNKINKMLEKEGIYCTYEEISSFVRSTSSF